MMTSSLTYNSSLHVAYSRTLSDRRTRPLDALAQAARDLHDVLCERADLHRDEAFRCTTTNYLKSIRQELVSTTSAATVRETAAEELLAESSYVGLILGVVWHDLELTLACLSYTSERRAAGRVLADALMSDGGRRIIESLTLKKLGDDSLYDIGLYCELIHASFFDPSQLAALMAAIHRPGVRYQSTRTTALEELVTLISSEDLYGVLHWCESSGYQSSALHFIAADLTMSLIVEVWRRSWCEEKLETAFRPVVVPSPNGLPLPAAMLTRFSNLIATLT